jgi:hypothetical protein
MSQYIKCSQDGYCKWLRERCEEYHSKIKKGLVIMELFDTEKCTFTGSYVGYKSPHDGKFMTLNFCPFCGFDFSALREKGLRVGMKASID